MEAAKIVLEFVNVLVWPIVVLLGFVLFKSELRALARSLQTVKLPGGTELDWQKKVKAVEEAADKVEALPKSQQTPDSLNESHELSRRLELLGLFSSPSKYDFEYYQQIAKQDPNLALAGLRMELERMLQNMARSVGLKYDERRTSPGRFSGLLRSEGILEEEEYQLIRSIINVANAALHGQDVSTNDAIRTIRSAEAYLDTYIPFMHGVLDRREAEGIDIN